MSLLGNLFKKTGNNINVVELKEKLDRKEKAFCVDVRTPGEFSTKKIKGFRNIPLNQVPNRLKDFPKDQEIILICQSGSRSSSAKRILTRNGYENVTNVKGGMGSWMMHRF